MDAAALHIVLPTSASALIEQWGVKAFAEVTGCKESHVRAMQARNSIPPCYWPSLVREAATVGLSGLSYEFLTLLYLRLPLPPELLVRS